MVGLRPHQQEPGPQLWYPSLLPWSASENSVLPLQRAYQTIWFLKNIMIWKTKDKKTEDKIHPSCVSPQFLPSPSFLAGKYHSYTCSMPTRHQTVVSTSLISSFIRGLQLGKLRHGVEDASAFYERGNGGLVVRRLSSGHTARLWGYWDPLHGSSPLFPQTLVKTSSLGKKQFS